MGLSRNTSCPRCDGHSILQRMAPALRLRLRSKLLKRLHRYAIGESGFISGV